MDRNDIPEDEIKLLRRRLREAEELIEAIRNGKVDALVVSKTGEDRIYTLEGADHTYRILIENMDEGALMLSKEGAILYCNRSFAAMLKIPINQVTGKTITEFFAISDQNEFRKLYNKVFTGDRIKAEMNLLSAGNIITPVLVSLSPFPIGDLESACMVVTDLTDQKRLLQDITERRRSEEALKLSERKFRGLFDHSPDAIFISIPNGSIVAANPAACKMFGCSEQELCSMGRSSIVDENDPRLYQGLKDREKTGRVHARELMAIRKNGEKFPVEVDSVILPGDPPRSFVIMRDITERKKAEEALRESRDQFQIMGETVPYGIWLCAPDGDVRYCSQSFLELLNMTQEEQQQFGWTKRLVPEDVAPMMKKWLACCATGTPWEHEHRIIDRHGKIHTILSKGLPVRDANGKITCWTGVNLDITARKKADQSLKESEQRLAKELNAAQKLQQVSSLLIQTDKIEVLYEKLLDTAMEILDADFASVQMLHQDGDHKDQLQLIANRGFNDKAAQCWQWVDIGSKSSCGFALRTRKRVITPNIEECPFMIGSIDREIYLQSGICAVQTTPLISRSGQLLGMLSTHWRKPHEPSESDLRSMDVLARQAADLIDRTQAEEKLIFLNATLKQQVSERTELAEIRSRKLQGLAVELIEAEERERRQFAHLLHDDLQQMLAAAKMQLQSTPNLPNEPHLKYVDQILEESITKTRRLSHDLSPAVLHHSGLIAGLRWLSGQMNEQFGLSVLLQADAAPVVENAALKLFLFRSVQELLFNTIKHAGVKQACVTLTGCNHHLVVSVSDQGCGFETKEFFKGSKKSGFGLLSIIERADYIGGSFKIDAAPGKGSRFILTVPFDALDPYETTKQIPSPQQDSQLNMPGKVASAGGTRVLFVDDHRVMRQGLIKLIVGQPGIHMIGEAENGAEALEQARHLRPDVIIMDISMPEMDGIEATRRIKSELPNIRVIGLTMHDDDQLIGAMQQAGAEVVLRKTISAAEMVKEIYGCQ